jgi:tetratricopeptide (TPR) repeat protein
MAPSTIKAGFRALAIVLSIVLSSALVAPRAGHAESRAAAANVARARVHFQSGKRAFESKHYAKALEEFEAGYALEPRAGFLLNMGHAARRMGDVRQARDLYLKFLATDPPADERRSAAKLVAEIERELSPEPAPHSANVAPPPPVAVAPAAETPSPPSPIAAASEAGPRAVGEPTYRAGPRPIAATARTLPRAPRSADDLTPAVSLRTRPAATDNDATTSAGPIYRRWWFWPAAGALAAGAVTAILVGALGSDASARANGSWGQIKL